MIIFAAGFPALGLLLLVPELGTSLYAVAVPMWGFYWLAVFTLGKTRFAWTETPGPDPWFLRIWPTRIGIFRFLVGKWKRAPGLASRPAALFEKMTWECVGLGVVHKCDRGVFVEQLVQSLTELDVVLALFREDGDRQNRQQRLHLDQRRVRLLASRQCIASLGMV